MRLRTKLIASFMLLVPIVVGVGAIELWSSSSVERSYRTLIDTHAPAIIALGKCQTEATRLLAETQSIVLLSEEYLDNEHSELGEEREGEREEYQEAAENLLEAAGKYVGYAQSPDKRVLASGISGHIGNLISVTTQMMEAEQPASTAEAIGEAWEQLEEIEDAIEEAIEEATELEMADLIAGHREATARSQTAKSVTIVLGATMALLAIALGMALAKQIAGPIAELQRGAQRFGAGNLNTRITAAGSQETVLLADEFNRMAESIRNRADELARTNTALEQAKREAENANRSKSEFLANMSHEIRTPMTAILGFTELLKESNLPEQERQDAINTIRGNGEHLLGIINDILDISKIEAGKLELESIAHSPVEIVQEVQSLMQVRANAKGLPLEVNYAWPIPEIVNSDPTRLKQVLINLTGNAIKFTDKGSVRIELSFLPGGDDSSNETSQPQLRFEVIDTGIGLSETQIKKLFQYFSQANASTNRKFGGTGLGLAISKRLIEKLGGEITVDSELGKGSTFCVTVAVDLPAGTKMLNSVPKARTEKPSPTSNQPTIGSRARRALLAEDSPDIQRLTTRVLENAGIEVTAVDNGKLAVEAAENASASGNAFDVILMDMQMPVMDGYDASRQLRSDGYSGPILALTAHAMSGDKDRCLEAGCDAYATKPVDRHKLISIINELTNLANDQVMVP